MTCLVTPIPDNQMAIFRPDMRALLKSLAFCLAVQCCLPLTMAQSEAAEEPAVGESFYLHDGDSVVFYGDSITEQGNYTRPIEVFSHTRCPEMKVSYLNSGWGGDRAWGGDGGTLDERLRRDVIAHRPTVVTVMLGMNDGYYMNYDPKHVAAFKESIEKLVDTLQQALPGVRITLIGTSPYDNVTPGDQPDWEKSINGGYNSVVARFSAAARDVAADRGLLFVDMNAPLVELLTQLQASNPELARQLIPDRIHPGAVGGLVMAARLLDAWHAPVSGHSIQIDAATVANGACSIAAGPFTSIYSQPQRSADGACFQMFVGPESIRGRHALRIPFAIRKSDCRSGRSGSRPVFCGAVGGGHQRCRA